MDGTQDLQGLFRVGHGCAEQCRLVSADIALRVTGRGVPGGRDSTLVIFDPALLDMNPVAERAPRRLRIADAAAILRSGPRLPALGIGGREVAILEVGDQLVLERPQLVGGLLGFQPARGCAAQSREQRRQRQVERFEQAVDRFLEVGPPLEVADRETAERPDLHRVTLPARCLEE